MHGMFAPLKCIGLLHMWYFITRGVKLWLFVCVCISDGAIMTLCRMAPFLPHFITCLCLWHAQIVDSQLGVPTIESTTVMTTTTVAAVRTDILFDLTSTMAANMSVSPTPQTRNPSSRRGMCCYCWYCCQLLFIWCILVPLQHGYGCALWTVKIIPC